MNDRSFDERDVVVVVVVVARDEDDNAERVREEAWNRREMYAQRGCASRGDTVVRRNTAEQNLTRSTQSRRRRRGRGRGRDEGSRGASKHVRTRNRFGSVRFGSREIGETESSSPASRRLLKLWVQTLKRSSLCLWLTLRSKV